MDKSPRPIMKLVAERTLEGLSWLSDRSFVMVSDLSKRRYHGRPAPHNVPLRISAPTGPR